MDSVTPRSVPVYGERESIAARINRRPRQVDLIAIMAPIFSRFEEEAQGNRVTKRVRNRCAWMTISDQPARLQKGEYKFSRVSPDIYVWNWSIVFNWKNYRGWKKSPRFENAYGIYDGILRAVNCEMWNGIWSKLCMQSYACI